MKNRQISFLKKISAIVLLINTTLIFANKNYSQTQNIAKNITKIAAGAAATLPLSFICHLISIEIDFAGAHDTCCKSCVEDLDKEKKKQQYGISFTKLKAALGLLITAPIAIVGLLTIKSGMSELINSNQ